MKLKAEHIGQYCLAHFSDSKDSKNILYVGTESDCWDTYNLTIFDEAYRRFELNPERYEDMESAQDHAEDDLCLDVQMIGPEAFAFND